MVDLSNLTKDGKALFLAYDQGMEHGPSDFNDENVDPNDILAIATSGYFTGVIFQKGTAEKYYSNNNFEQHLPLILKLNGKTNLVNGEDPYSPQICSVSEAIEIGAAAVGYTIYVGSSHEPEMFKEFSLIEKEAHDKNIPVIGWMYIRGSGAKGKSIKELTAYGARLGLEMGADIVKIKYPGDEKSLRWAVESAGRTKVVVSGGEKKDEETLLKTVKICMDAGAIGMAVGRNIWQNKDPLGIAEKIKQIIWP
ncbi:MAG: fructose-bisphosphate aldolase [Patescibacteria group bacterium]